MNTEYHIMDPVLNIKSTYKYSNIKPKILYIHKDMPDSYTILNSCSSDDKCDNIACLKGNFKLGNKQHASGSSISEGGYTVCYGNECKFYAHLSLVTTETKYRSFINDASMALELYYHGMGPKIYAVWVCRDISEDGNGKLHGTIIYDNVDGTVSDLLNHSKYDLDADMLMKKVTELSHNLDKHHIVFYDKYDPNGIMFKYHNDNIHLYPVWSKYAIKYGSNCHPVQRYTDNETEWKKVPLSRHHFNKGYNLQQFMASTLTNPHFNHLHGKGFDKHYMMNSHIGYKHVMTKDMLSKIKVGPLYIHNQFPIKDVSLAFEACDDKNKCRNSRMSVSSNDICICRNDYKTSYFCNTIACSSNFSVNGKAGHYIEMIDVSDWKRMYQFLYELSIHLHLTKYGIAPRIFASWIAKSDDCSEYMTKFIKKLGKCSNRHYAFIIAEKTNGSLEELSYSDRNDMKYRVDDLVYILNRRHLLIHGELLPRYIKWAYVDKDKKCKKLMVTNFYKSIIFDDCRKSRLLTDMFIVSEYHMSKKTHEYKDMKIVKLPNVQYDGGAYDVSQYTLVHKNL